VADPGARFGVSSLLFCQSRLDRDHLVEIAAHGFDAVELVALRSHFDYTDPAAVAQLAEWLDDTRLSLSGVHVPPAEAWIDGGWVGLQSIASRHAADRARAVQESAAIAEVAAVVPFETLTVRVGVPGHLAAAADDDAGAAHDALEKLAHSAAARGLQLALEVQTNELSTPDALVAMIEGANDWPRPGICLDTGYARLLGDPVDAIETASGHIVAAHLHDTDGRRNTHLVPFDGSIDWEGVLLAFQKVGYNGPWTFELAPTAPPQTVLARAAAARRRFEQCLGFNDELTSP
jgi:sugar phosphate isomerase/epimerase